MQNAQDGAWHRSQGLAPERGTKMHAKAIHEKRRADRHDCVAATKWSCVSQPFAHHARILNFSSSGIYLETDVSLKPGTTVWIRVDQFLSGGTVADSSDCLATIFVADAKWCRELPKSRGSRYGVGLRYEFPMI